jgi:hypothetical protein
LSVATSLVAQSLRQEEQQLFQRRHVRDLSGGDVLDAPGDATRRAGANIQLEHKGAVRGQLERDWLCGAPR